MQINVNNLNVDIFKDPAIYNHDEVPENSSQNILDINTFLDNTLEMKQINIQNILE